ARSEARAALHEPARAGAARAEAHAGAARAEAHAAAHDHARAPVPDWAALRAIVGQPGTDPA
ncbi:MULTISPECIES: hypothetical protein, partial [Curtobacterium]|uniref:hypothetical protein n=1 Tax=Curtobacterium flaccumfaciens TaxID=2035 RepID=UPI003EE6C188